MAPDLGSSSETQCDNQKCDCENENENSSSESLLHNSADDTGTGDSVSEQGKYSTLEEMREKGQGKRGLDLDIFQLETQYMNGQLELEPLNKDDGLEFMERGKEDSSEDSSTDSSLDSGSITSVAYGCRVVFMMVALVMANLLNYMDRTTIAGVLLKVQDFYDIENADAGLLQTSFIVSYMIFSPIFGFLGDRYNRKLIMAVGVSFWSVVTLAGSFVPADKFWLFLFMRALVGVGEASYSTIAPTIIADLFVKDMRTFALALFYFAIPVGSGLGYIVGANVAEAMGSWQWALRVTPALGIVCVILILTVVQEPPRGASEGGTHLHNTSYCADLRYLVKNKSFLLSSAGFTCVAFVAGAMALWTPTYMDYSYRVQQQYQSEAKIGLIFGLITCLAGILGVGIGSETARRLRRKFNNADPLVCAFGLIASAPFLYLALVLSKYNIWATWLLIFIGEVFLCLNWAIVTDIVLYVVIPTRRSTAEAFQILMSHALGDAGSPYLMGMVSDSIARSSGYPQSIWQKYLSLHYAMYMACFASVLGGGFFLFTALFIREDRAKADLIIRGAISSGDSSPVDGSGISTPTGEQNGGIIHVSTQSTIVA